MVLDEATSSLDNESEKFIQKSINELSKNLTMITIAHRLSTIVNSDHIYVMKNGTIVESGTYDDLFTDKNSIFYQMVSSQHNEIS